MSTEETAETEARLSSLRSSSRPRTESTESDAGGSGWSGPRVRTRIHTTNEFHHCAENAAARSHREHLAAERRKHTNLCKKAKGVAAAHRRHKGKRDKNKKKKKKKKKKVGNNHNLKVDKTEAAKAAAELRLEMAKGAMENAVIVAAQAAFAASQAIEMAAEAVDICLATLRRRIVDVGLRASVDADKAARRALSYVARSRALVAAAAAASVAKIAGRRTAEVAAAAVSEVSSLRADKAKTGDNASALRILEAARRSRTRDDRVSSLVRTATAFGGETSDADLQRIGGGGSGGGGGGGGEVGPDHGDGVEEDDASLFWRLTQAHRQVLEAQWHQARLLEDVTRHLERRASASMQSLSPSSALGTALGETVFPNVLQWQRASLAALEHGQRVDACLAHVANTCMLDSSSVDLPKVAGDDPLRGSRVVHDASSRRHAGVVPPLPSAHRRYPSANAEAPNRIIIRGNDDAPQSSSPESGTDSHRSMKVAKDGSGTVRPRKARNDDKKKKKKKKKRTQKKNSQTNASGGEQKQQTEGNKHRRRPPTKRHGVKKSRSKGKTSGPRGAARGGAGKTDG